MKLYFENTHFGLILKNVQMLIGRLSIFISAVLWKNNCKIRCNLSVVPHKNRYFVTKPCKRARINKIPSMQIPHSHFEKKILKMST